MVEKKLLVSNDEITKAFNEHFAGTMKKINIFDWPWNNEDVANEDADKDHWKNLRTIQVSLNSKINTHYKKKFLPVSNC